MGKYQTVNGNWIKGFKLILLTTLTKQYKTEHTKKHPGKCKELKNKIAQSFPSLLKLPPPLLKKKKIRFFTETASMLQYNLIKTQLYPSFKRSLIGIIQVTAIGIHIVCMGVQSSFYLHAQGWDRETASFYTGTHSPRTAHVRMKQILACPVLGLSRRFSGSGARKCL